MNTIKPLPSNIEALIQIAHLSGIEVRFAKYPHEFKADGVHIVEPDLIEVIDAIDTAIVHGLKLVVIHTKLTWPYRPT